MKSALNAAGVKTVEVRVLSRDADEVTRRQAIRHFRRRLKRDGM